MQLFPVNKKSVSQTVAETEVARTALERRLKTVKNLIRKFSNKKASNKGDATVVDIDDDFLKRLVKVYTRPPSGELKYIIDQQEFISTQVQIIYFQKENEEDDSLIGSLSKAYETLVQYSSKVERFFIKLKDQIENRVKEYKFTLHRRLIQEQFLNFGKVSEDDVISIALVAADMELLTSLNLNKNGYQNKKQYNRSTKINNIFY